MKSLSLSRRLENPWLWVGVEEILTLEMGIRARTYISGVKLVDVPKANLPQL